MEDEINAPNETLSKWHIVNAGLVIIHPFLPQLFKSLEYLDDMGQFKNEELQFRAVYLLHYVATGQNSGVNETELAISKIFSGMLIEVPIPLDLVLSEKEKGIAIELLTVLIDRWEKLGNTSLEGLQNTFLKRSGLVEYKNRAYQLSVETSGTDILLDFIPWSINIIKLPWVKQIIYSSWR